jgi:hypothetical protein
VQERTADELSDRQVAEERDLDLGDQARKDRHDLEEEHVARARESMRQEQEARAARSTDPDRKTSG